MTFAPRAMISLSVSLSGATYDGLGRLAHKNGMKREVYGALLLTAAYSARVKPDGADPELEAAVADLKAQPAPADDTIRHLLQERDSWKKTAEQYRGERLDMLNALGEAAQLKEELKAAREACSQFQSKVEQLERHNSQLQAELANCARPLPPIVTVTAKPDRSPALDEALAAMATTAATALREQAARGPEPYGLDRKAAEEAPSEPEVALTPAFIKSVAGYHWAGVSVEQIARSLRCDEAAVRRALKAKGRAA
jgi:hypothetical protein